MTSLDSTFWMILQTMFGLAWPSAMTAIAWIGWRRSRHPAFIVILFSAAVYFLHALLFLLCFRLEWIAIGSGQVQDLTSLANIMLLISYTASMLLLAGIGWLALKPWARLPRDEKSDPDSPDR